jgi:alkanesulfonate monooxygenase SsuD/methylene tetrahydromethanopterin reductase-like flavin-dependent oxidoreductase (luciferase family)
MTGFGHHPRVFRLIRVNPHVDRTRRTAELVDQLHAVVDELEKLHPGRKFPLDGHLVGSLGEAAGEAWLMPRSIVWLPRRRS